MNKQQEMEYLVMIDQLDVVAAKLKKLPKEKAQALANELFEGLRQTGNIPESVLDEVIDPKGETIEIYK